MNNKKPTPLIQQPDGKTCPVCGKRSYSPGGIHPQCAVAQADVPRQKRLAAEKEKMRKLKTKTKTKRKSWNKRCPKCDVQVHVRLKVCACGHKFNV